MMDLDEFDTALRLALDDQTRDVHLPAGAAREAIGRFQLRRRRRRRAAAAGALVLAGLAGVGVLVVPRSLPAPQLPDRGPDPTVNVSALPVMRPVPALLDTDPFPYLWITGGGRLEVGALNRGSGDMEPLISLPLSDLPDPGAYRTVAVAPTRADVALRASVVVPPDGRIGPQRVVLGVVRGHAARVVVDLPDGAQDAHLAPTVTGDLTLYWLVVTDFDVDGRVARGPLTGRSLEQSVGITVIDGGRPVFACEASRCRATATGAG